MFWTRTQAARHVENTYDEIAPDFARSRERPWKELEILFRETKPGARILDLGCGNGRLIPLFTSKQCRVIGTDVSANLIALAAAKLPETKFVRADMRRLPFPNESFDEVWAVASLHHLCQQADQLQALQEIARVLVPEGKLVLTFWNLWHLKKYAGEKRAAYRRALFFPFWRRQDFLIPWNKAAQPRYYYAFQVPEIIALARQAGFSLLEWWGAADGKKVPLAAAENICLRFQKQSFTASDLE